MNYDEFDPTYSEQIWDDAEEWERDRLAEDISLGEGRPDEDVEPDVCAHCVDGWVDIHDQVAEPSDIGPREHELRGGRIHVKCRDCGGTGAPF